MPSETQLVVVATRSHDSLGDARHRPAGDARSAGRSLIALALAASLASTTACTMSRGGRAATVTAGSLLTVAGVAVMASGSSDSTEPTNCGSDGCRGSYDFSPFVGAALLGIGIPLILVGLASHSPTAQP